MINRFLKILGLRLSRIQVKPSIPPYSSDFDDLYDEAMERCGLEVSRTINKRVRKFTMLHYLYSLGYLKGAVAECGSFKGTSAYMMAKYLKSSDNSENGLHIFDSFEGLSDTTGEDSINDDVKGLMKGTLDEVKSNLSDFDFIEFNRGWIPDCFDEEVYAERKFSFVHIDVDLYKPIKDSLDFFYPKMLSPGFIVIDDYYLKPSRWPGAVKAVEEFVQENRASIIRTTIGLAVIRF